MIFLFRSSFLVILRLSNLKASKWSNKASKSWNSTSSWKKPNQVRAVRKCPKWNWQYRSMVWQFRYDIQFVSIVFTFWSILTLKDFRRFCLYIISLSVQFLTILSMASIFVNFNFVYNFEVDFYDDFLSVDFTDIRRSFSIMSIFVDDMTSIFVNFDFIYCVDG